MHSRGIGPLSTFRLRSLSKVWNPIHLLTGSNPVIYTKLIAEATTIPLAALTASVAVFRNLGLPTPWNPATKSTPFLIYGASSAVGSYAIRIARNSNIHPIIAVAGKGSQYVETLLDRTKGDTVFDYRNGPEETVRQIREHLKNGNYG